LTPKVFCAIIQALRAGNRKTKKGDFKMKTERSFDGMSTRYKYDAKLVLADGWCQFDTDRDAAYFGNWVNPKTFETFSYCEGDTCLVVCESQEEFVKEIHQMMEFYGEGFRGIDCGIGESLRHFTELFNNMGINTKYEDEDE
jgi:hypothetical protein